MIFSSVLPVRVRTGSGDCDIGELVTLAGDLGQAGEDLAVVDLDSHADAHVSEYLVDYLHHLQFVEQGVGAHYVHIALVELAVAAFLGTIGPPYRLDLVPLEGECQLVAVLDHEPRERHRQVIAQPFLADFQGQRVAACFGELGGRHLPDVAECVSGVENLEEELVSFLPVFAQQGGEVLHRRSLDGRVSVFAENGFDSVEDVVASGHLGRTEIPGAFGYGWFLRHIRMVLNCKFRNVFYICA